MNIKDKIEELEKKYIDDYILSSKCQTNPCVCEDEEKSIIEKFRKKFAKHNPGWRETGITTDLYVPADTNLTFEQFLLTELQALKEEVVGEEKYSEQDNRHLSNLVQYKEQGWNDCRQHTIDVFKKFGIK